MIYIDGRGQQEAPRYRRECAPHAGTSASPRSGRAATGLGPLGIMEASIGALRARRPAAMARNLVVGLSIDVGAGIEERLQLAGQGEIALDGKYSGVRLAA